MLCHQPAARMDDTGLEVIVRHYIGLQTQKRSQRAPRHNGRSAFAFIDGLLRFSVHSAYGENSLGLTCPEQKMRIQRVFGMVMLNQIKLNFF